ncbi:hypothetical protein CHARACLAT_008977 [Characodon lateralis]|uniref:Uncharacterized protein n=1 Tax=Characodon lateralis TaxID=208331 RepID=A0ABU7ET78_9TELE|nr:hypothetical protein [Characodon lateralis]
MGDFKCGALKDHWLRIIADLKPIGSHGDAQRSQWVKLEEGNTSVSSFTSSYNRWLPWRLTTDRWMGVAANHGSPRQKPLLLWSQEMCLPPPSL